MVQSLRQAFPIAEADPTVVRALAGELGLKQPGAVFVVGLPRSGSTLIEQILASHPQVFGAGAHCRSDTGFDKGLANTRGRLRICPGNVRAAPQGFPKAKGSEQISWGIPLFCHLAPKSRGQSRGIPREL
jgi:hypothetical protein